MCHNKTQTEKHCTRPGFYKVFQGPDSGP